MDPSLRTLMLDDIDQNVIEHIAKEKEKTNVSASTVNRMLEIIRAILNKAHKDWEWLDNTPRIRMRKIENKRIRWLTKTEANKLLDELPNHLELMAAFTLATGLRQSNVTGLKWTEVNFAQKHALVNPEDSKTNRAIPVPLNQQALAILEKCKGNHSTYVFTYQGRPVSRCNNHAWRKALIRANIENFKWHDLRHTWASWHVQHGTSLQELQQLGGWSNYEMVLRYAHLSSDHLRIAAERVQDTFWSQ
jgi:integrase